MQVIVYERGSMCGKPSSTVLYQGDMQFIPRVGEIVTAPVRDQVMSGLVDIVEHEVETGTIHIILSRCRYKARPEKFEPTFYA